MTKTEAFRLIGGIDEKYVEAARRAGAREKKAAPWKTVVSAAACLCLITAAAFAVPKMMKHAADPIPLSDDSIAQEWSASMKAEDYFRHSGKGGDDEMAMSDGSIVMPPYAHAESLSDERAALEAEGVLPSMPDHHDLGIQAEYNGDGSLYKVWFMWMRRSEHGTEGYSDLKLTAAPQELHEISDTVYILTDENGREIPDDVTATVRDGVLILAQGRENGAKTMTWQTEEGWYQISGSWNDRFEDVVALFEWFWEHPLDLSMFAKPQNMRFSDRSAYPDAFREMIPDFSSLGYTAESELVNLGRHYAYGNETVPVWFEGVYVRSGVRIRWTVSVGADKDDWDACLGRPREVTEEKLTAAMNDRNRVNLFFDVSDLAAMATVCLEEGEVQAVWELIRSMQE